ncbi:ubiquitin carboxyl-terminal hydrolase 24-like [Brachionus plicatilis]|uniref:Ubiquitin carboxyl-terminal hydrolase 24-like n=1 Tax=Brachionus plicatilis TaxID=10195 RepID=A0A3M7SI03_BRAPC|nr:ubiquitin carboxyl-terminal hydrolase 24-like [Brachionus plicatilis]
MQGENNSVGLLTVIRNNLSKDPKKSYNCIKLIVSLANKNCNFKEYLLNVTSSWEWSVSWLKTKMSENNFESATFSPNSSNIQSSKKLDETKTFQRTKSAQTTLEHAMDLLSSNSLDV